MPGLRVEIHTRLTEGGYMSEVKLDSLGAGHLVINSLGLRNRWGDVFRMVHSLLVGKGFTYSDEGNWCALYKKSA